MFPTPPPLLASATVEIRSNGLRIAPPTTSGSSSISRFDTAVAIFASSVCSVVFSATTFTVSAMEPRFNATSTRAVAPAVRMMPWMIEVRKPCSVASMRYVPGGRLVALKLPESDETTFRGEVRPGVDHLDRHAGDGRLRLIGHHSGDGAAFGLSEGHDRKGKKAGDDETKDEAHEAHDFLHVPPVHGRSAARILTPGG